MLSSFILQFADDLTLAQPIFNINDCQTVQNDLDIIYNFCNDNHLKLNPEKCVTMRVTLKNTQLFEYKINEIPLKNVLNKKIVGIIMDSKMSFNLQVDSIVEKSLKKFYFIKLICKGIKCNIFVRCLLYRVFILSHIQFIAYLDHRIFSLSPIQLNAW